MLPLVVSKAFKPKAKATTTRKRISTFQYESEMYFKQGYLRVLGLNSKHIDKKYLMLTIDN